MKLLYIMRFLINHIFRDWLRSILTILSLSIIAFIFFLSSALISDMGNFGNGLIDVPQTLIFMSRNAMLPTDSHITVYSFDTYQTAVREISLVNNRSSNLIRRFFVNCIMPAVDPFFYTHPR